MKNNDKTQNIIINPNTGEIVGYTKSNNWIKINDNEQFIKLYKKSIEEVVKILSLAEINLFNFILQYLPYQDCILRHDNNQFLLRKNISDKLDISLNMLDKTIRKLIKNEIIIKQCNGKEICLIMNPFIVTNGIYIKKEFFEMFKYTKWAKLYKKS